MGHAEVKIVRRRPAVPRDVEDWALDLLNRPDPYENGA